MPRTGHKSSPALRIELDDPRRTYFPGETLNGYVICETPPEKKSPYHAVRLKMFGRAKTKYVVKRSNGTSRERGRAVLFEKGQMLHRGSICQNGQHAWAFSISIPEASMPGFGARGDSFKPAHPYLSTLDPAGKQEIDLSKHPLPPIMYYFSESVMSGKTVEAYIEYVLVAEGGDATASLPLYVRRRYSPVPITDYHMKTKSFYHMVKTPRLLPEHADKPLTFEQKMSGLFRPSKTPRYTYTVKVEYPTLIQLEHPHPIPLRIYIAPILNLEKTTICPEGNIDNLPPVEIVSMEIGLQSDVNIRCPGTFWDSETTKEHTFDFHFQLPMKPATVPIVQEVPGLKLIASAPEHPSASYPNPALSSTPSAPTPTDSNISPDPDAVNIPSGALDLGTHNSILLGSSASSTLNLSPVSFKRQIYPTFQTYNINIAYRLNWKIKLSCAGETQSVESSAPVRIVAPSEEQEVKKQRQLGTEGMKKNYDEMKDGFGEVVQFIGEILQAVL